MKKTVRSMVAASLVGVMAVSLAGCGSNKQTLLKQRRKRRK